MRHRRNGSELNIHSHYPDSLGKISSSNGTLKLEKIPFWGTTFDFDCSNRSLIFTRKIRKLSHLDQSWGDSTLPQNIKNYYFLFPSYFLSIFARPCSSPDLDRHHHLDRHHQSFRNYRLPLRFPPLSHHLEAFDQMDSQNSSYFTSLLSGGSSTDDPLFTQDYGDVNEYSPNVPQVTNTPSNTSSIARKNQRGSNFAIDDDMMLISAYLFRNRCTFAAVPLQPLHRLVQRKWRQRGAVDPESWLDFDKYVPIFPRKIHPNVMYDFESGRVVRLDLAGCVRIVYV
ncbi:uncharacterized protein LOC119998610 [Tripterygium wilfordii]|uniref:uncharacterized protein LOC119998610 n=1 Tax=Tripterygium wilfordii TaxID=458696 RepID=UPI0018F858F6|nr:uncharacterized protein LOC119998610 [Tripterygium wilfordii]